MRRNAKKALWLFIGTAAMTMIDVGNAAHRESVWRGGSGNWSDASQWSTYPLVPDHGNGGHTFDAVIIGPANSVILDSSIDIGKLEVGDVVRGGSDDYARNGSLTITSGGQLNSQSARLGVADIDGIFLDGRAHGTVTVDGSSAVWTNAGLLNVGPGGVGTLNVLNGAQVSTGSMGSGARQGYIFYTDGTGHVRVSGDGSQLTTGNYDTGPGYSTLRVEDNGRFEATVMDIDDGQVILDGGYIQSPKILLDTARGKLLGQGAITGDVTVTGGAITPERITISGNLQLDHESSLSVAIGGDAPSEDFSQVQIEGTARLAGLLEVSLSEKQSISLGDAFEIVTATRRVSGSFDEVRVAGLPSGLQVDVSYAPNAVSLAVVADGSEPQLQAGDADQDLDFDWTDILWVQHAAKYLTGEPATWGEGDWNGAPGGLPGFPPPGDGVFDQKDIVAALAAGKYRLEQYSAVRLGGNAHAAVPEPGSFVSLCLGLVLFALVLPRRALKPLIV